MRRKVPFSCMSRLSKNSRLFQDWCSQFQPFRTASLKSLMDLGMPVFYEVYSFGTDSICFHLPKRAIYKSIENIFSLKPNCFDTSLREGSGNGFLFWCDHFKGTQILYDEHNYGKHILIHQCWNIVFFLEYVVIVIANMV